MLDRFSVDPRSSGENGPGKFRCASFLAVNEGYQHVEGIGSGYVVVLVHARDMGFSGAPFHLNDPDILGHFQFVGFQPVDHIE